MALGKEQQLDQMQEGNTTSTYMNIPREKEDGFFTYPEEKQYVFPFNIWVNQQTREDYRTDKTKKPARVLTIRILPCTEEDIVGREGSPATYTDTDPITGNREIITEAIPAKIGFREYDDKDTYSCAYETVINHEELENHIIANKDKIVRGQRLGLEGARKDGVAKQFYVHAKTLTNLCGIDMTDAEDVPPLV